jgi:hypothetical protein
VSLHPLRILWTDPNGLASADAAGVVRCDDGCDYVIKDDAKHAKTMHSEWFCSRLADAIGIAVPPYHLIERPGGSLVFGSRWEGGVANEQWHQMIQNGTLKFEDVKEVLANVFAFDNFIHNVDRHARNYLVRSQRNGFALLAPDYSRAWYNGGFPLAALPLPACNTINAERWITTTFGKYVDVASTRGMLDKIESICANDASDFIKSHPQSWLTQAEADAIVAWWSSAARTQRIDGIRQGIKDGKYL